MQIQNKWKTTTKNRRNIKPLMEDGKYLDQGCTNGSTTPIGSIIKYASYSETPECQFKQSKHMEYVKPSASQLVVKPVINIYLSHASN